MHRRLSAIKPVQVPHPLLYAAMEGMLDEAPVQALFMVPLAPLSQLRSHEQELLARMGVEVSQQQTEVGEFLPVVAGHFCYYLALAVHHLVVGQGEHEVFGEGVPDAEGKLVVMVLAVDGLLRKVREGVVHPSHVPLHAEAEPADIHRPRDHRPGRGFLGYGLDVGVSAIHLFVQFPEKGDGVDVLLAAVRVRDPLALFPRVIQVEHGRNRVDPEPVHVVLFEPEEGVAHEKGAHFVPAVVEDVALPVRMKPLLRVLVLVEVRAVEIDKAVEVARVVRRHPIEDHPDAVLVEPVDKIHEVLGRAIAACRSEIARDLVTPGAVEGMLHHRHELHVGKAQLLDIRGELLRKFAVGKRPVHFFRHAAPGAGMDFIDRHRRVEAVLLPPPLHPLAVAPLIREVPDNGGGPGRRLGGEGKGVGLVRLVIAAGGCDVILVARAGADAGDKSFPYAGAVPPHAQGMGPGSPAVEIPDDRDFLRIRGPDREVRSGDAVLGGQMRAELVIQAEVASLLEKVDVVIGEEASGLHHFCFSHSLSPGCVSVFWAFFLAVRFSIQKDNRMIPMSAPVTTERKMMMARDAWVCHARNETATGAAFCTEKTMTRVISTSTAMIVPMGGLRASLNVRFKNVALLLLLKCIRERGRSKDIPRPFDRMGLFWYYALSTAIISGRGEKGTWQRRIAGNSRNAAGNRKGSG